MNLNNQLNEKQKQAVVTTEGRIRVVAGAGSGKTRIIAHRYAYLVNEMGIDPANILCTTFTNKAAKEMASRISKMVQKGHYNDFVCTIHGFCVKFLRKEIYRLGFPSSFSIIDDEDAKILAREVMDELKIDTKSTNIQHFLDEIAHSKRHSQTSYIGRYLAKSDVIKDEFLQTSFIRYLHKQLKLFALDFQDLIYFTLYILEKFQEAKDYWCETLNYIMVDEAQDLSRTQWKLIEILASEYENLFIVGDPDQAIYEWRGASPELFVNFRNDETIVLNENYRSTPNILNVANSVIENNTMRVKKELFTRNAPAAMVMHHHSKSENDECEWIAKQISSALKEGKAKESDFAILFRASYLSRSIEQSLIKSNIKYVTWGGVRFFERREVKDTLAYLRLIVNGDNMSFLRIINVPSRKMGKTFISKLKEIAEDQKLSYYDALKNNLDKKGLDRLSAKDFISFIDESRYLLSTMSISDFTNYVVENSGLKTEIRESGDEERLDNLNELISSIKLYEDENRENEISLTSYLQDIALFTNADYKSDAEFVKLMTIHQAKGLEFPYIFLVGVSEGILPNYRSIRERKKNGEEEERRLMYVAITRAEKGLFLSESEGYMASIKSLKYPSRFIAEIKNEWLVIDGENPKELRFGTDHLTGDKELKDSSGTFEVGEKVSHKIFGEGTVVAIFENGSYQVEFDECKRNIMGDHLYK